MLNPAVEFIKGGAQGVLNTANGLTDAGIGTTNLMIQGTLGAPGQIFQRVTGIDLTIPSPDFSKGVIVQETEFAHNVSKFLGGEGVIILATFGLGFFRNVDKVRLADDIVTAVEVVDETARVGNVAARQVDNVIRAINQNADNAVELARRATARGRITNSPQAFGSRASRNFERLNKRLDRQLADKGSSFKVVAEEFRDAARGVVERNAKGSIAPDVSIRGLNDRLIDDLVFDLKTFVNTPRSISPVRQTEILKRFGAPAQELFRRQ